MSRAWTYWVAQLVTALVVLFLISPVVVTVLASLTTTDYVIFPPQGITLRWYMEVLNHPEFIESFVLSLGVAMTTAAVATVLGTLAALALVRYRFTGRDLLQAFFLSPLMLPSVVLGVGLLQFYSRLGLAASPGALVLGHLVITVPYVIRLVSASLAGFDRNLERAAANLGATPLQVLGKVTLPIIKSGILAGLAFAFVVSFDDLTIALFVVSTDVVTLPVRIFSYLQYAYDPLITSVSTLLILFAIAVMVSLERILGIGHLIRSQRPRGA